MTALFFEILDNQHIRVMDGQRVQTLTDADAISYATQSTHQKRGIVLLDSLHIQSKRFTQPVKDKKILKKVITADISDYLLGDSESYHIAYQTVADSNQCRWVSWIEQARRDELVTRFSPLKKRIQALVSLPLLAGATLPNTASLLIKHTPLVYTLTDNETAVMSNEQASAWLQNTDLAFDENIDFSSQPDALATIFTAPLLKNVPNLWQTTQTKSANPTLAWQPLLAGLGLLLWVGNSYLGWQTAKQRAADSQTAQVELLKQVFPNAKGNDPYGRLRAEFNRLTTNETALWQRLDNAMRTANMKTPNFSAFSVDMKNQRIVVRGTLDKALITALTTQGFKTQQQDQQVTISW